MSFKGIFVGIVIGYVGHDVIQSALEQGLVAIKNTSPEPGSTVTNVFTTPADDIESTTANPAFGSGLPLERINEINAATTENPVTLTDDEVAAMAANSINTLREALGAGRLKIEGTP